MVAIVIELSLERWLSRIKEVKRQEVIPYQGGQTSGFSSTSNLDDRDLGTDHVSRHYNYKLFCLKKGRLSFNF